jgi:pimeloyl-ACP methyl ester carboxylesterase
MTYLLLHGTPLSPQVWGGVRTHLGAASVAPDLMAAIATAPSGYLPTQVAASALAATPDSELVVVGHSFGGQIAIEAALLAPQRVRRLIVVCSRHTPFPAFAEGARAVRAGRRPDIDAGMRRWFMPGEIAAGGPLIDYMRHQLQVAPRGPWAASLDAVATYDRSADVGRITTPTLLLGAEHDEVATPRAMTELAAALPLAHLEIDPDWAHMSPFVDPAALAARMAEFVGSPHETAVEPTRNRPLPSTP